MASVSPGKTEAREPTSRSGSVQSVDRALSLLEALGEDEEGCRLIDLAGRTNLSPSTAHRLLTTLQKRQFVQFDSTEGLWHVGRQSFIVGARFVRRRNFVATALPYLRRLRDLTRETANLGYIEDGEVVVLSQVESREIMRAISRVGGHVPIVNSGLGKAILATYSPAEVAASVAVRGMQRFTQKSILRMSALKQELERVRSSGYAVDDEEYQVGLRCIAATVYDSHSEVLCAVSVSGLTARLTYERVEPVGEVVAQIARELTISLGGRAPGNE
ncbi:IclR family transcriptional regulator [Mesorhizobium sp. BR1-1-16]|uniref:IclR family transcriptional regulator n=1 Tax=Mesorhizobium sp. BR1-1-16 TaxID=2876653 RepID=UPI001CCB1E13|nr:IclR family transcriptional regulator [Mesorhizobium sp. BR1-1-16]MBZ9938464.1 IclR family transcriptional regulator [Mesorhizobium sp. BR1-1-16]